MAEPIQMGELLSELQSLGVLDDMSADGFTAKELRGATGWGETKARRWVTKCIDAGKLTFAGRTMRPKVDGAMAPVPVYQIVKKAKAASRRRVKRG